MKKEQIQVDMEILTKKIKEYITNFEPELNLLNEKCYKVPKYTTTFSFIG